MINNKKTILSGRYELLESLGQGQSGDVFLARQQSLGLKRAIKRISKNNAPSLFAISEANILRTIHHPGIPTIYDLEEDEFFYYLVEEYVQGESLDKYLLHQQFISQNLFLKFCSQLCDIFSYLHTLRPSPILYQDLKPEHIIVCGLQIKLIDFGVASFITNSGNDFNYFGNEAFSAPEFFNGQKVTLTSDIFSIGKIMEYMLPHVNAKTARNVQPIIQKAMNTEPALRYSSIRELQSALKKANDNMEGTHLRQTIAVIGSHSGCGSTHIAISLTTTLNAFGYDAVYMERNNTNSLRKAVMQLKNVREWEGCFHYQCFKGYPKYDEGIEIPMPSAEIIVEDYGYRYDPVLLSSADTIIYICGGSLWHRDDAMPGSFLSQQSGNRIHYVVNLCSHNSAIYFARKFSAPVYPYPYDTDIFRTDKLKTDFVRWLSFEKGRNRLFSHLKNHFSRLLLR